MSRLFTVFSKGGEAGNLSFKKVSNSKQLGKLEQSDLANVVYQNVLHHRQFSEYYDQITLKDMEEFIQEVLDGDKHYMMIAVKNDKPVGIAVYFTYNRYKNKVVYIQDLVVLPEHRSHSVGANLLKQVEMAEKNKKGLTIELTAFTDNVEAVKFYQNQGMFSTTTHFAKNID